MKDSLDLRFNRGGSEEEVGSSKSPSEPNRDGIDLSQPGLLDLVRASVSNGSNPLERFRVRVGTGTKPWQRFYHMKNPDRCIWAGFHLKSRPLHAQIFPSN
jgi:hypothetical protein